MKLSASPVKRLAQQHGMAVAQPRSLKPAGKYPEDAALARDALQSAQVDAMVVAAYGLILPAWVLALPPRGCLNIHASLLPRWRGAAPIHRAIEAGDGRTGITIMQMDAGLDTGDMLLTEAMPIARDDTTTSLHDRLAILGGRLVVEALELLACCELKPIPQPDAGVTYAHKIEKTEAAVDWAQPAEVIERRIRAFDPFPGVTASCGGELVKLWRAKTSKAKGAPGTVLAADAYGITVACGSEGALTLMELQRPGGKRMAAAQFLQSHPLTLGRLFSA